MLVVENAEVVKVPIIAISCLLTGLDSLVDPAGSLAIDGKVVKDPAIVRRQVVSVLVVVRGLLQLLLFVEQDAEVDACLVVGRLDGQDLLVVCLGLVGLVVALQHDCQVE